MVSPEGSAGGSAIPMSQVREGNSPRTTSELRTNSPPVTSGRPRAKPATTGGSSVTPAIGWLAIVSDPTSPVRICSATRLRSLIFVSVCSTSSRNAMASAVGRTRLPERTKRAKPTSDSSRAIGALTAGWVRPRDAAAWVMEPLSRTLRNASRRRGSICINFSYCHFSFCCSSLSEDANLVNQSIIFFYAGSATGSGLGCTVDRFREGIEKLRPDRSAAAGQPRGRAERCGLRDRTVRFWQEHLAALPRATRATDRRNGGDEQRHDSVCARHFGRPARGARGAAGYRHGVPALQSVAPHDGARQSDRGPAAGETHAEVGGHRNGRGTARQGRPL